MTHGFRFIVIADSHIRPSNQEVDAYPSNALLVRRNEYIVDLCNQIDAAFVVHLGDIVHPLPVEDSHAEAIDLAADVYAELQHPIHFVAGNHDVGDKPNALVAVPAVAEENYSAFEDAWGPSFYSFNSDGCHFTIVDTQLLNSGLDREKRQRTWLEADLDAATAAGMRIFMLTHYPPFVLERYENEHYDNLGEPARSWFLDLLVRHEVEAVFSGHVHNFLYNRHGRTDLYVSPSTGFVRPDFSELLSVQPLAENGRDDPPKLGILVVDITQDGHVSRPLRSFGLTPPGEVAPKILEATLKPGWESPIGVTLRHGWATVADFPTAGLDEFNRKQVRNDALVYALWEARIRDVRIPLGDISTVAGARRAEDLTARGMQFSVFSAGVPDDRNIDIVKSIAGSVKRWEVIVPPESFNEALASVSAVGADGLNLAIAPIVPSGGHQAAVHHFVSAGFGVGGDPNLERWLTSDVNHVVQDLVFRIPWGDDVCDGVIRANALARECGRKAVVIVDLPRDNESSVFDDDEAVERCVATAVRAATSETNVAVFLDMFVDHDRGYYPRHGLIDRAYNPRPALYRLIQEAAANQDPS
ncbi:MAG: metallophosphoesterase [Acidimicrobiia bacterium]|nr:MAG: metallophosphoesterase [Acidimicrobiia bacterium]